MYDHQETAASWTFSGTGGKAGRWEGWDGGGCSWPIVGWEPRDNHYAVMGLEELPWTSYVKTWPRLDPALYNKNSAGKKCGWVKTLYPFCSPQVIAGLKWMFIPFHPTKNGIFIGIDPSHLVKPTSSTTAPTAAAVGPTGRSDATGGDSVAWRSARNITFHDDNCYMCLTTVIYQYIYIYILYILEYIICDIYIYIMRYIYIIWYIEIYL